MWNVLPAIVILIGGGFANYYAIKYHEHVHKKLRKEGKLRGEDYWDYWWWGM